MILMTRRCRLKNVNGFKRLLLGTLILTFTWGLQSQAKKVTVMTYNVENLFDTLHDPGKKDYDFLPLSVKQNSREVQNYCRGLKNSYYKKRCLLFDWTPEKLIKKLRQLARVIRLVNEGQGPDVLVLQEVENLNVLKQLVKYGLVDIGYKEPVLIEGPDRRGIDVGMISKFPKNHAQYHYVDVPGSPTRGILEVEFQAGNSPITVLGNHWPSQANPDKNRLLAARTAHRAIQRIRGPVVVTGDFNTLESDSPHGINEYILKRTRVPHFNDAERKFSNSLSFIPKELIMSPGTHFYNGKWASLDRIFVIKDHHRRLPANLSANWASYSIVSEPFMLQDVEYIDERHPHGPKRHHYKNVPKRFNWETGEGFSDHLPVVLNIEVE